MSSANGNEPGEADRGLLRRRLLVLVPLAAFLALAALFMYRLGAGDPSRLPSALIGRPAPATPLPPLAGLERDGPPVPGLDAPGFNPPAPLPNPLASLSLPSP